jgi:hypothetical protein
VIFVSAMPWNYTAKFLGCHAHRKSALPHQFSPNSWLSPQNQIDFDTRMILYPCVTCYNQFSIGIVFPSFICQICLSFTYDHRTMRARLPVRSAIFKHRTGGLVVKWVTISESPLLYVFESFCAKFRILFSVWRKVEQDCGEILPALEDLK